MKLKKLLFFVTLIISLQFNVNSFGFDLGGALNSLSKEIDKGAKEFEKNLQSGKEQKQSQSFNKPTPSLQSQDRDTNTRTKFKLIDDQKIPQNMTKKDIHAGRNIRYSKMVECAGKVRGSAIDPEYKKGKKKCAKAHQASEGWSALRCQSADYPCRSGKFISLKMKRNMKEYPEIGCMSEEGAKRWKKSPETLEECKNLIRDIFSNMEAGYRFK
jgi:hypothetical protein